MPTIEQAKSLRLRRMVGSRAAACTDICSHNSNLFQLSTSIPQNIRIGFFNPRLGAPHPFLFFSVIGRRYQGARRQHSAHREKANTVHVVGEIYGGSAKGNKGCRNQQPRLSSASKLSSKAIAGR